MTDFQPLTGRACARALGDVAQTIDRHDLPPVISIHTHGEPVGTLTVLVLPEHFDAWKQAVAKYTKPTARTVGPFQYTNVDGFLWGGSAVRVKANERVAA